YGTRMAILPAGSKIEEQAEKKPSKLIIDVNGKTTESIQDAEANDKHPGMFPVHMADTPYIGTIFACILVAVIIITNVPLRGMWSIVVIMLVVISIIFFTLLGWWGGIFWFFRDFLHVHINAGGYMFISTVLLAVWLVTVLFFDPQVYMIF